jgi:hypothetical protein
MKPIGGYFELELKKGLHQYHDTPYMMKSGRSSLHYLLAFVKPTLVYIPYYTCNALLEPFDVSGTRYEFYEINEQLEPKEVIDLNAGEYFLYVNYLDLKRDTVDMLSARYGQNLIVDCTQAFFMKGNGVSWYFNSCRKFFGVPDGSYLYAPDGSDLPVFTASNEGYIIDHLIKRFNGHPGEGYKYFQENEVLAGSEIAAMSRLSEYLLSAIDYDEVIQKRCGNYKYLHQRFAGTNLFIAELPVAAVPMSYPLLLGRQIDKLPLFKQDIFIPTFWVDTLDRIKNSFEVEKDITKNLLPLPIDQRFTTADMETVCMSLINVI